MEAVGDKIVFAVDLAAAIFLCARVMNFRTVIVDRDFHESDALRNGRVLIFAVRRRRECLCRCDVRGESESDDDRETCSHEILLFDCVDASKREARRRYNRGKCLMPFRHIHR